MALHVCLVEEVRSKIMEDRPLPSVLYPTALLSKLLVLFATKQARDTLNSVMALAQQVAVTVISENGCEV